MKTIEIDFDVWQQLTTLLRDERDSLNNVLRRVLKLKVQKPGNSFERLPEPFRCKGGIIPIGTQLMSHYEGKRHDAEMTEHGIKYQGKYYNSPSRAATAITKTNVNGWIFWNARLPGDSRWQSLSSIRQIPQIV